LYCSGGFDERIGPNGLNLGPFGKPSTFGHLTRELA